MKLYFLAFALLMGSVMSNAQSDVKWAQPFETSARMNFGEFIGEVNGEYYNLMWELDKRNSILGPTYFPTLEVFDNDLNFNKKIVLDWNNDYGWLEGHVLVGNELHLFGLTYDKDADEITFRELLFNLEGELIADKALSQFKLEKKKMKTFLREAYSPNKTYGSFFHPINVKKKDPLRFQISTYNLKGGEIMYEKDIIIDDYLGDETYYNDHVVDERGYTYIILNTTKDKKDKLTIATLFVYDDKGNEVKRAELIKDDEYLRSCELLATTNGDIYLAAFLMKGKTNKRSRYSGFSIGTIEKETLAIKDIEKQEFTDEMLYKMDAKPKNDGTIRHRGVFNLNFIPKGQEGEGGYVVAEAIYATATSDGGILAEKIEINAQFRELIVIDVLPGGKVGNSDVIPKYQLSGFSYVSYFGFSSSGIGTETTFGNGIPSYVIKLIENYTTYFAYCHDGMLTILFNGDKKNSEIETMDDAKSMTNAKKAYTMKYTYDGDKLTQDIFMVNKDEDAALVPSRCHYSGKEVIIGAQKGKNTQYGFMVF